MEPQHIEVGCEIFWRFEAGSFLAAALGLALVQNGRRVLFMRTTELVQRLQVARRELGLEAAITKLDKYQLLILDDIAYVTKDQAETSVLFELIAARYEGRSLLITANQPFGEWGKIFPDQAMTLAAIDRLVHHATILEMNVESCRRKARSNASVDQVVERQNSRPLLPCSFATDAKALTLHRLRGTADMGQLNQLVRQRRLRRSAPCRFRRIARERSPACARAQ